MKQTPAKSGKPAKLPAGHLDFLPDPDAIEQRPLAGVTRWVLYGLTALLLSFLVWSMVSEIDEVVTAQGRLVTTQPNLVIQPMETAIIQSLDVRIGQVVRKGQRLAQLDPTFAGADESSLRGGLSSLDARTRRLESEVAPAAGRAAGSSRNDDERLQAELRKTRKTNFRARLLAMDENLARLAAAQSTNRQDQQMLEARVKSLLELEQMQERLVSQNFGARRSLLEAREKKLEIERDLQLARNREEEIRREIAAARAERNAFESDWRQKSMEELADVRRERDSVAEQLQKAERRRALVSLLAPVDAVVLDVAKRSVGTVAREAEMLFTLVPLDVPLEAEVQIEAADVGFVKAGDPVRIKLDAYPFQKHGTLVGRVRVVSEDTFARDAGQARAAGQTGNTYYLARITLDTSRLERTGSDFRLLPGLSLAGEIKVGKRSIISYFLYPLIRTMDESLNEPR